MARPALSDAQLARQRRRLTAAALDLYRTRGYEAVTLRRVATRVRMSHVTPYRYFESKDELLAAMKADVFAKFAEHMRVAAESAVRPIDRLRRLYLSVFDFARRHPADYRLIFSLRQPLIARYPLLRAAWKDAADFVILTCQQAIDAGQLQGDATTWVHVAWSSIHGLLSLHVANLLILGRDFESLIEPVMQTLLPDATCSRRPSVTLNEELRE